MTNEKLLSVYDNLRTAGMFRREAEGIIFARITRETPLAVEEQQDIKDKLQCYSAHTEHAVKLLSETE